MAALAHGLSTALAAVRQTNAAHLDALAALEHAFDAEMAQLARDRRALDDDRAAFVKDTEDKAARDEVEEARIRASAPPPDELIKLNVGGARFETSRAVLTRIEESMLGRMFGRCDAMLQPNPDDGSIFIDRDGERFAMLLDFLRGDPPNSPRLLRAIRALPSTSAHAMLQELDYFGLEAAVFGDRPWTDGAAFRPGPATNSKRAECAAVLAGGRVIVFGGIDGGDALNTTEVADARTMAWTAGPDMLTGRYGFAAVQLDADRVLLAGGHNDANQFLNTTEIFHLSTHTITAGPNMLSARGHCAAVALDARRILVVGGFSRLPTTEILSLDTMTFTPGPSMASGRLGCAAVALDEHRIMVAGGINWTEETEEYLNTTEILEIRIMSFTPGPTMSTARSYCTAVSVDALHVLITGGEVSEDTTLATTELLDVAMMEFAPGPAMLAGRDRFAAVRLDVAGGRPRIFVVGGARGTIALSTTEVLAVEEQYGARSARRRPLPG